MEARCQIHGPTGRPYNWAGSDATLEKAPSQVQTMEGQQVFKNLKAQLKKP